MIDIPLLISRETEIQGLKKLLVLVVIFGSLMLALSAFIYMHRALHVIMLPIAEVNIASIGLYSILGGIAIMLGAIAIYGDRMPSLRIRSGRMSPAFMAMLFGYVVAVSLVGMYEMLEIFATEMVPAVNFLYFSVGFVPVMVGTLSYILRVYSRLVELGAETPPKKPYVAELYLHELRK